MDHGRRSAAALSIAAGLVASVAWAQAPGFKRSVLQRADIEGHDPKECVLGNAELAPGASTGRHIHHGFEQGVVIEGDGELSVDGDAPRKLKAGDSYRVEARRPHEARNTGSGPMKLVATWVVEKGKPLAEPVK